MLFSEVKDRSLLVLKFVMAVFIVIAPTLFGFLNIELSACILFLLTGILYVVRMRRTGQGHISICQFIIMTLLFYSLVSTLWADNRNAHFTYILVISGAIMFFSLVTDYFYESSDKKVERRMMYMLCLSGTVCALWNFIYWIAELIPYGIKESFCQGLGSSDFLAVFMLLCIIVTYKLIPGNKRIRRTLLVISLILMIFTFVMAGGVGWFLFAVFAAMYFVTRKTKKFFVPMELAFSVIFLIFVLISGSNSEQGMIFKDVFGYGTKNLFGHGGFWSARELFFSQKYADALVPGLFATLCASSGFVGIICCVCLAGRAVFQFIKLKSWVSAANIFVTVMIMFFPFSQSLIPLFLWVGLLAYNEKAANLSATREFGKDTVKFTTCVIVAISVLTTGLMCQIFIKMNASDKYDNKKYLEAYKLYNTAATINPVDGESARMAAKSLYMSESIENRRQEALLLLDKAQKRDKYNLENRELRAQIYYKCGMYELSAQEYASIAAEVKLNGSYNLEAVKSLYNIIKTKEKGSSEAISLYQRITTVADRTQDLDYKEKINNIADKALVYTKGELAVEQ